MELPQAGSRLRLRVLLGPARITLPQGQVAPVPRALRPPRTRNPAAGTALMDRKSAGPVVAIREFACLTGRRAPCYFMCDDYIEWASEFAEVVRFQSLPPWNDWHRCGRLARSDRRPGGTPDQAPSENHLAEPRRGGEEVAGLYWARVFPSVLPCKGSRPSIGTSNGRGSRMIPVATRGLPRDVAPEGVGSDRQDLDRR